MRPAEQASSSPWFWPVLGAVGLHAVLFGLLFVSFASTPDLPPARPVVQATLYEMKSKSQAESQTRQKIAGEAKKTAAREFEMEQLQQRKAEEQRIAAAKAEEQKRAEAARKAEAEKKAAEQKRQAEVARKKAEDEAKKKAAEAEARKKVEEEKARKAAEALAKKKAAEEEAARKAQEELRAQALAELLKEDTERQAALADEVSEEAMGNIDDLLRLRAAQGWSRPPSARPNMTVRLRVTMLPDGTITGVNVANSSGDIPFDNSAVAAVRNIGRVSEVQSLKPKEFERYRSFTMTFTPEDLAL